MTGNEAIARHLAGRGPDAIEKMAAIVSQAREMLAHPEITATQDPLAGPNFGWQTDERIEPGTPKRMYVGSVEDNTNGFGMLVWVFSALARTEGEFRRIIASHVGFDLADTASVSDDANAPVPYQSLIQSPGLRNFLTAGPSAYGAAEFDAVLRCRVEYG